MIRVATLLLLALALPSSADAQQSGKKRRPLPHEYGTVIIRNNSEAAGLAPVVFEHWLHRAKFTCRLCHVDIGFAMTAGATKIRAADNASGLYCGACHNNKPLDGKVVFEACTKAPPREQRAACLRCHFAGKNAKPEIDFGTFSKNLPKGRFGNGIDWEKAEKNHLVTPVDYLEGVSIRRKPMAAQKDFALEPNLLGMPNIIFSHEKHTVWNGCELCHPEIFVGVKKGATKYSMVDIFEGKSCGVCHATVAFPLLDCQRCHTKPVQ